MDPSDESSKVSGAVADAVEMPRYKRPFPTIRKWRIRLPRILVPVLLVQYILRDQSPPELFPLSTAGGAAWAGIFLIALGALVRVWARGFHVSGTLFTRGPYAVMRHPLYLGTFFIACGMCMILNDWVMDVAFLVFFGIIYTATMYSEDAVMKEKFGETHAAYQQRVPALIPYRGSLWKRADLAGWDWRVFRKTTELGSFILILMTPLFLEGFKDLLELIR